jgi:hypothetical protein
VGKLVFTNSFIQSFFTLKSFLKMKIFFTVLIALISPFGRLLAQCPTSIAAVAGGNAYNLNITNVSQCVNYAPLGTRILNINGTPYGVSDCGDDSGSPVVELTIVAGNTPVPSVGTVTITGITGSPICRYNNGVLPVELLSFTGKNTEGSKNNLTWRTESEKNNKHFDIERSTDGTTFHPIGQVKGNNKPSSYQFVDNQPFATTYYRLRQIDFDGTETYSKIVSVVQTGKGKGLTIYPNPVSNTLTVDNMEEDEEVGNFQILNLFGQQVLTGKTMQQLDVSALAQGTYVLKVGAEQVKFVKE